MRIKGGGGDPEKMGEALPSSNYKSPDCEKIKSPINTSRMEIDNKIRDKSPPAPPPPSRVKDIMKNFLEVRRSPQPMQKYEKIAKKEKTPLKVNMKKKKPLKLLKPSNQETIMKNYLTNKNPIPQPTSDPPTPHPARITEDSNMQPPMLNLQATTSSQNLQQRQPISGFRNLQQKRSPVENLQTTSTNVQNLQQRKLKGGQRNLKTPEKLQNLQKNPDVTSQDRKVNLNFKNRMNFFQNLQDRNKLENNTTAKLPWNEHLQNTDYLEPVKIKGN